MLAQPAEPFDNVSSGVGARNGSAGHTIDFTADGDGPFTPTEGRVLVLLADGPVTHDAPGWVQQLAPVQSGELAVFTRTAQAGDTDVTLTHNGSGFPICWTVFEFPAGSVYVGGTGENLVTDVMPTLSGLPGTAVCVIAARGRNAGDPTSTATTEWSDGFVEVADVVVPLDGTDGTSFTVARRADVIDTASTPTAVTTVSGSFAPDRQAVVFAVARPATADPGPDVTPGRARPVGNGQSVQLDLAAVTPTDGETITGHSWSITSGGGSLAGETTPTPTYTAPGSGTGTARITCTVSETGGLDTAVTVLVGFGPTIVVAENQLPGTGRGTWDLTEPGFGGIATLQGFADGFSVDRGDTVDFKIGQSDAAGWVAQVYRLGWYAGNGARLIAELAPDAAQLAVSQVQPEPLDVDPETVQPSVDCANWAVTLTWAPPSWAVSGIYLLRLDRTGGGASHVMFVLRDDNRAADLMLMPADSTWQAYNAFGGLDENLLTGNSLYAGTAVNQYSGDAARRISCNRPVVNRAAHNIGQPYGAVVWSNFFTGEYPMLRFLERNGYDVKYYSCLDAAGDPEGDLLGNVGAAVAVGHNEYWSDGMRAGWEAAKAAGTSLFFCAANEVFWRFVGADQDAAGRPRTWECHKSTIGSRDSTDRPKWTGTWRDPAGAGKGGDHPENLLTGTIFVVNGPDLRPLRVPSTGGFHASPLWRDTVVADLTEGEWESPDQIVGFEWDTYGPAGVSGTGAAFLAEPHPNAVYASAAVYDVVAGLLLTDAGDVYDAAGTAEHRLVIHPSSADGGITFGTGTVNWALGVDSANTYQQGGDNTTDVIRQATVNILTDMGALPGSLMAGLVAPTPVAWFPSLHASGRI